MIGMIGHDLYLWSPKGFLTGSANTPGSILVGTHFERTDVSLRCPEMSDDHQCRSVPPRHLHHQRVGSVVLHRAANEHRWEFAVVRCEQSDHPSQRNLGVKHNGRAGGGGSWTDGNLNWRYQF